MLSGSPDIVFLRLTFLGRRDTVSVLMRERRTLACRSNTAPGGREGESAQAGGHTGKHAVALVRTAHTRLHALFQRHMQDSTPLPPKKANQKESVLIFFSPISEDRR